MDIIICEGEYRQLPSWQKITVQPEVYLWCSASNDLIRKSQYLIPATVTRMINIDKIIKCNICGVSPKGKTILNLILIAVLYQHKSIAMALNENIV